MKFSTTEEQVSYAPSSDECILRKFTVNKDKKAPFGNSFFLSEIAKLKEDAIIKVNAPLVVFSLRV